MPQLTLSQLDRSSFVPLYYQLQEVLKQHIESGHWSHGDTIPSEPELCRVFGVSRIVVRQALAILEDDRQIVRIRGRGTFVAQPKLDHRAGGLARLLEAPRRPGISIQVLDVGTPPVGRSIRARLAATDGQVLRLTTLLSVQGTPLAISYSYFKRTEAEWLEHAATVGLPLPDGLVLADHGIELAHSDVAIETSQCGQFEADRFGIPHRSAVFLVLSTEYRTLSDAAVPFEVARAEYRGDLLQLRLELAPGERRSMAARLDFSESPTAGSRR